MLRGVGKHGKQVGVVAAVLAVLCALVAQPAAGQAIEPPIDTLGTPPSIERTGAADAVAPAPATPTTTSAAAGAWSPFKHVSIPAGTVTDLAVLDDGDMIVASGDRLHYYLSAGLYSHAIDLASAVTGMSMGGASLFIVQADGTHRYDGTSLDSLGHYPQAASLTDHPVAGGWLLYVDAQGRFGRQSMSSATSQVINPPAGQAVAFYGVPGSAGRALGVTASPAQLTEYDLTSDPATVVKTVDLVASSDPLTVVGPGGDGASVLVRASSGTVRRVTLPLSTIIGTDLSSAGTDLDVTTVSGTRSITTPANDGWDALVPIGNPGTLHLARPASTTASASEVIGVAAAAMWNANGTLLAVATPPASAGQSGSLQLYTPPGEPRPATPFSASDGEYSGIAPVRALDTRTSTGPLGANGTVDVTVTGIGGVPAGDVLAVAVNLTVVDPSAPTYLAAFPAGGSIPFVSTVNAAAQQTRPNLAIVRVGVGGRITVLNAAGQAHAIVDVLGYFSTSAGTAGGRYHPITPTRLLDSRDRGAFGPGALQGLAVRNVGGVPANATAVAVTVTAVAPSEPTFVTVYPSDAPLPLASNLNPVAGETAANLVFTRIGADGNIAIFNAAGVSDVLIDVVGYWNDDRSTEAGRYIPFGRPFRYFDTREDPIGPMEPDSLASLRIAGWPTSSPILPTPPDGAMAVAYNLTVTDTTAGGYVTAYPGPLGTEPPWASTVNFAAGATAASQVITGYGDDGRISLYNPAGSTHVILDVAGFFTSSSF